LLKVVLDTNIIISAVLFGGRPRELLKQVIEGKIIMGISLPIIEEVKDVLSRDKFNYPAHMRQFVISQLEEIATLVEPTVFIGIIEKDDDDNRILECAVEFGANCIISGDSHLLELKNYNDIEVVSASIFLDNFID